MYKYFNPRQKKNLMIMEIGVAKESICTDPSFVDLEIGVTQSQLGWLMMMMMTTRTVVVTRWVKYMANEFPAVQGGLQIIDIRQCGSFLDSVLGLALIFPLRGLVVSANLFHFTTFPVLNPKEKFLNERNFLSPCNLRPNVSIAMHLQLLKVHYHSLCLLCDTFLLIQSWVYVYLLIWRRKDSFAFANGSFQPAQTNVLFLVVEQIQILIDYLYYIWAVPCPPLFFMVI